jgi:hypothetical protein
MFSRLGLGLLFCHAVGMAQITNSVTVNASQTAAQPDSVVFSVTVTSGFGATLESVVNAVSSLGITAANLTGLGVPNAPFGPIPRLGPPQELWTFQLAVPFTQMKSTSATLAVLQKSILSTGLSLSWTLTGTQTSPAAASACNVSNLTTQASVQAQQIASAASVKLGAISQLAISTSGCSLSASYALSTAQPGQRLLTATASQPTASAAPDQVQIYLSVSSPLTATLNSVTAALTKAGINGASFAGVNQNLQTSPLVAPLLWTFTEMVSLAKLAPTLTQLTAAERNLGGGLQLVFGPNGVSYSQPPSCPEAGLLSQAQNLAQNLAAAAGASAGPLLSMSSGAGGVGVAAGIPAATFFAPQPGAICSLTAQFQLF